MAIPAATAFAAQACGKRTSACPRKFRVTERFNLDFRTEVFNLFNRAQYGNPVSVRNNSTFGSILVTAGCATWKWDGNGSG